MNPSVGDLEQQAISAYLVGNDEATEALWIQAHNECVLSGDLPRAARCIGWLVLDLFNRREWARGNGWLERGMHLLESVDTNPALGLLLVLAARNQLRQGNVDSAAQSALRACELAQRFNDPDLNVFSRMSLALVHARQGEPPQAAALFDEIMVSVTVDDVSPIAVGVVYCAVIEACRSLFDFSRARQWTAALDRWIATQPNIVAFRGKCLVHRSEILRQSGAWSEALVEAERACTWSGAQESSFKYPTGDAFYELGEIHRLRGNPDEATAAYRNASEHGHVPEPGLTLLQFAQGKDDVAATSIRRLLSERQSPLTRAEVLLAAADILTITGDLTTARAAADELGRMSERVPASAVRAFAAQANGAVSLAENQLPLALRSLREAWTLWQELELPYHAARVRLLIGQACLRVGDHVASAFELDAARQFFERVSAQPDIARVDDLRQTKRPASSHPLSARELQVIELIASGRTNREIARHLSISERTVDRHVSNILLKLNLPTRSAATAYAFQNDLIAGSG